METTIKSAALILAALYDPIITSDGDVTLDSYTGASLKIVVVRLPSATFDPEYGIQMLMNA